MIFRAKYTSALGTTLLALISLVKPAVAADPTPGSAAFFTPDEAELVNTLKTDDDAHRRIAAARQIGMKRDPRFLDILTEALEDHDEDVQTAAVKAIADLGTNQAVYTLEAAASNPACPPAVSDEACARLGKIAAQRKTDAPLLSLLDLTQSAKGASVRKAALEQLNEVMKSYDAATLAKMVQFHADSVRSLAETESTRRNVSGVARNPPAGAGNGNANPAVAAATGVFTADDLKILEDWRKPQADQLRDQIMSYNKMLEKLKVTDRRRQNIRKQMNLLELAKGRLITMSPTELGAAMCRKAENLLGQSFSMDLASKVMGEASKQMAAQPPQHWVVTNGWGDEIDSYDTDNSGPALIGMLLAAAAQQQAQAMKAEGNRLRQALESLSPDARAAISTKLAEDDAQQKPAKGH